VIHHEGAEDAKRFLDLADFSRDEIVDLLALAKRLEQHPEPQALAGKILGLCSSTPRCARCPRSRPAWSRLGGTLVRDHARPGHLAAGDAPRRVMNGAAAEHVREGIPVLASTATRSASAPSPKART
jgi:hypothetical protein